ncbi:MAG TPA: hypothetical protein VMC43_01250 [Candidatus Paceibacterota bacterium]|nr:hypothetical protein [Candidatus Paceibacterota bacterium]
MNPRLFVSGLCLMLFAVVLELKGLVLFGFAPDLALAAGVVLGAFFNWPALIFTTLLTVLLLNWQPGLAPALILFAALVFGAALARRFLSWQPWFANLLLVGLAAAVFHGFLHGPTVLAEPITFFQILVTDILFAALAFWTFELVFGPVRRARHHR